MNNKYIIQKANGDESFVTFDSGLSFGFAFTHNKDSAIRYSSRIQAKKAIIYDKLEFHLSSKLKVVEYD